MSHKVKEIKEGRYLAVVKAARKAEHKVTVAHEKELKKPQQNHSKTLSVQELKNHYVGSLSHK